MAALTAQQLFVIDNHFKHATADAKQRVPLGDDLASVYDPKTGRLHAHYLDTRCSGKQELVFESMHSRATTLTSHNLKFWDLRRFASPRELARVMGFPDTFQLPAARAQHLFGNAVAVPCATHACRVAAAGAAPVRTFVDICAGIGGFSLAATSVWSEARCVGYCEIKRAAIQCYTSNFPAHVALGDVTKCAAWPRADLVMAGFPCQPFSRAQKGDRESHHANTFFDDVMRAIDSIDPRIVILENVRSMLNTAKGRIEYILDSLRSRGYDVAWQVLNAADFGLPQQRHRVYIVARKDCAAPLAFPVPAPLAPATLGAIVESSVPLPSTADATAPTSHSDSTPLPGRRGGKRPRGTDWHQTS